MSEKKIQIADKKAKIAAPVLKNPIFITVAVTLIAVILFGSITGIIIAVRNSRALITIGGVRIEKSAAAYLATSYKTTFMTKYNVPDSQAYWASEYMDGVTYGELLESETEAYLREVAVGAYLFDRYSALTRDEKKYLEELCASAIIDFGCADKADFEAKASEMGFDYKGFSAAITLLYKKEQAKKRIYGEGGSVLRSSSFDAECEKYYSHYVYTKLLIIRTEFEYKIDDAGGFVVDEYGNLEKRELTAEEYSARMADIAEIRDAITALENGSDGQMGEVFFDRMLNKYNIDDYTTSGYYFSPVDSTTGIPLARATAAFAEAMGEELLEFIYTREMGEYAEIEVDGGVCFVYRGQPAVGAYASRTYEYFFDDFFSDAADYLYSSSLNELLPSVEVKTKYYELIDITTLPYNWQFNIGV